MNYLNLDDEILKSLKNKESKHQINEKLNKYFKEISKILIMAERLGFEPRKELPLCRFSRPVLSTAQPSLLQVFYDY